VRGETRDKESLNEDVAYVRGFVRTVIRERICNNKRETGEDILQRGRYGPFFMNRRTILDGREQTRRS